MKPSPVDRKFVHLSNGMHDSFLTKMSLRSDDLSITMHIVFVSLKAEVGYIRQKTLQFHHFHHGSQAVNIYRSLSLI